MIRLIRRTVALSAIEMFLVLWIPLSATGQAVLWEHCGEPTNDTFGMDVEMVDDLDGDTYADVLVAEYAQRRTFVYSGASGNLLSTIGVTGGLYCWWIDLESFGDFDKDSHGDFLVLQSFADRPWKLVAYSGATFSELWELNGTAQSRVINVVATLGDLDNDSVDEFIIGSADGGGYGRGEALVYSGQTQSLLYAYGGINGGDLFGWGVSSASDVNSDGVCDFVIGSPGYDSPDPYVDDTGRAVVYSGKDGQLLFEVFGSVSDASFGSRVGAAGDVDADSHDDILVVAPFEDTDVATRGRAYVYSGISGQLLFSLESDRPASFGINASAAGDFDRDGYADICVSSNPVGSPSTEFWEVDVVSGKSQQLLNRISGNPDESSYGLACDKHLDRDSYADEVVGFVRPDDEAPSGWVGCVRAYSTAMMPPKVLAISPNRTRYDSPVPVEVTGQYFSAGDNGITVLFGSSEATDVVVVDDSKITCTVPTGEPGPVDVSVYNSNGTGALPDGFWYTPSIGISGEQRPGGEVKVEYSVSPGDAIVAIVGVPPPIDVPTPPFDGSLCISHPMILFIVPSWPFETFVLEGYIKDDPNYSGIEVLLQALVGPDFSGLDKDASWTNCAVLTIE